MTEAERRRDRIVLMAGTVREGVEKIATLVAEARDNNDHIALGYPSWTAYLSDVLGKQPIRLGADERRELVGFLAGEGMSTRAIAPIVGVSERTAAYDAAQTRVHPLHTSTVDAETGEITQTPVTVAEDGYEPARSEGGVVDPAITPARAGASAVVTGLDGKTYARPEPKPAAPRATPRRPLPDQFVDAVYELNKAVERLLRLQADDRFPQNAEKVALRVRGDLLRANDSLAGVISAITNQSGV